MGGVPLASDKLWGLVDSWVRALPEERFRTTQPLLQRTIANFAAAERRQMGERVRDGVGPLTAHDLGMDQALKALYNSPRTTGLGGSSPKVARWLRDTRECFPSSVVRVLQADALERMNLRQMLLEPEMLATVEPGIHPVTPLMSLSSLIPNRTKHTARLVIR